MRRWRGCARHSPNQSRSEDRSVAQVNVKVNGYSHTIGCKDGEEEHLRALVSLIEDKARTIRGMGGQFSESRMLLHVALLLADECGDLRSELARARSGQAAVAAPAAAEDPELVDRLERIAERIEGLAQTLDRR
jgi:cell division protein ZapA